MEGGAGAPLPLPSGRLRRQRRRGEKTAQELGREQLGAGGERKGRGKCGEPNIEAGNPHLAAPDGDQRPPGGVEERSPPASSATTVRRRDAEREAAGSIMHRHVAAASETLFDDREIDRNDGRRHGHRRRDSVRGVRLIHGMKQQEGTEAREGKANLGEKVHV